jgi:hypothetical protein
MSGKTRSLALIIIGMVLVLLSLVADMLGVGAHAGFGWKQITGTVVGVVLSVVGVLGLRGDQP